MCGVQSSPPYKYIKPYAIHIQKGLPPYFLNLYYTWPPLKKFLKTALNIANNVYELQYLYERQIINILYEQEV